MRVERRQDDHIATSVTRDCPYRSTVSLIFVLPNIRPLRVACPRVERKQRAAAGGDVHRVTLTIGVPSIEIGVPSCFDQASLILPTLAA